MCDKTNDNGNKNDDIYNICQIVLKYELIYIIKFIIFIVVAISVSIPFNSNIMTRDLIGTSTFVFTTTLDSFVLARSIKNELKGPINIIHLFFTIAMLIFCLIIVLIYMGYIAISSNILTLCNWMNITSCCGPLMELAYDTMLHFNNEKNNDY